MSNATNNQVDRVLISEGSRLMANGRGVRAMSAEAEADDLREAHDVKQARKRQIEARLASLNARVLTGGRMPNEEYRSIVQEQTALKGELGQILADCATMKLKLSKMRDQVSEKSEPFAPILREILEELKLIRTAMQAPH